MFKKYGNSQPLVSVVIPTYNRPVYLKQAISSAVKQTYQNIEIIVSDNCSSENPQPLIESFQDSRIKFWRQSENVGMFSNQMHAFKMAQGKYVASLHDDDIWHEDFLIKLVPHLEANSDVILAFCDQYIIDSDGNINEIATVGNTCAFKRNILMPGIYKHFTKIGLVNKSIATAAACVIRNHIISWNSIPPEVGGMWDLYLTYLCCISGLAAYYHSERLTYYRVHEQTDTMLSGSKDAKAKIRKANSEIFCYKTFMENNQIQEFHHYFQQKWLEAHTTLGIGLLRDQQILAARPYLWQALKQQKIPNLRALLALTLSFTPQSLANQLLGVSK